MVSLHELEKSKGKTWLNADVDLSFDEKKELIKKANTCKYRIKANNTWYYADMITIDSGYVRFIPVAAEDIKSGTWFKPTEALKEMWVRADVIEDPVFTTGAEISEILLALVPIAAMFLLPRVLR